MRRYTARLISRTVPLLAATWFAGVTLTAAAPPPPDPPTPAPGAHRGQPAQLQLAVQQTGEVPDAHAEQLAYSPDGRFWITGEQQTIGVYQGLQRLRQLDEVWVGNSDPLFFSADGKQILAGGHSYNFADGKPTFAASGAKLSAHRERGWEVAAAVVTPDARQCLAWLKFFPSKCCREHGHNDSPSFKPASPLFVINLATGAAVPLPLGKESGGEYQALAANAHLLVVGGVADTAAVFNRHTLTKVATLDVAGPWYGFHFSADGKTLVGIYQGRELIVYDTQHFARRARFEVLPDGQWISALAMHPRRPVVAVSGWDGQLRLYSLARGDEGRLLTKLALGQAAALAFNPAGDELLAAIPGSPKDRIIRLSVK